MNTLLDTEGEGPLRRTTRRFQLVAPASRAMIALAVLFVSAAVLAGSANAAPATRWFWVQHGSGWEHLQCLRLAGGRMAEVYAPVRGKTSRAVARALVSTFEHHIFPTDTRIFGVPSHLGKVAILLAPLDGITLGYFDQNDLMPSWQSGFDGLHGNRGNVLYVRAPLGMPDRTGLVETNEAIAHEFQHLINYRVRTMDHRLPGEDDWLNEGLSFYAQIANGYWTYRDVLKVRAAAREPTWPVTELSQSTAFLRSHARVAYGRAGLFVSYLASRFGDGFVRGLVVSRFSDLRAVNEALRSAPHHPSLAQVFADWGVAQDVGSTGALGYGELPSAVRVSPSALVPTISSYPFTSVTGIAHGMSLKLWSHAYLRFTISRSSDVELTVTGPAGRLRTSAILRDSGGLFRTRVHSVKFGRDGKAVFRVRGFGGFYDQMTLALADTGSLTSRLQAPADTIGVTAKLVRARDFD